MIHEGSLTEPFLVNSGVKQGCLLSPFLFLLSLDWVTKESLAGQQLGIRWTILTKLDDLEYADDICLLASTFQHVKRKTEQLNNSSGKIGQEISTEKTKQMGINPTSQMSLFVNGQQIETVSTFTYLGSIMNEKGGTDSDVLCQINKIRAAFASLKPVWRSTVVSLKTKIRLFNSNMKTILLYGSECWKISKEITHKLRVFVHKCLRIILRIRWPMKISNKSAREKCNQEDITVELANRRWSWIGHVLRKPQDDITKEALFWTPDGRRRRGRPCLTWRRSVESELKGRLGLTWSEASRIAQDRERWRDLVGALCATWRKEA